MVPFAVLFEVGGLSAEERKFLFAESLRLVRDIVQMDLVIHIRSAVINQLIKVMLNWIESIIIYHLINSDLSLKVCQIN